MVLKPVRGHVGYGVFCVESLADFDRACQDLKNDKPVFKDENYRIWDTSEFILETFLEGQEVVVDMFYDQNGKPQIVNVYLHPESKYKDYEHLSYRLLPDPILYQKLIDFFNRIYQKLKLRHFPIHAEFKYSQSHLCPIELNPYRWGALGMVELSYYSHQVNAYHHYFKNKAVPKDHLQADTLYHAFVLGYIPKAWLGKSLDALNESAFKAHLKNINHYVCLKSSEYPFFALAYVSVPKHYYPKILETSFDSFFE